MNRLRRYLPLTVLVTIAGLGIGAWNALAHWPSDQLFAATVVVGIPIAVLIVRATPPGRPPDRG